MLVLEHYRQGAYGTAYELARTLNNQGHHVVPLYRAMCLGQLGFTKDAQASIAEAINLKPNIARHFRAVHFRRNVPGPLLDHMMAGLDKAGLTTAA